MSINGNKPMKLKDGKILYDDLAERIQTLPSGANIVMVQDQQPALDANKVWLTETPPAGVEVPTYGEFTGVIAPDYADLDFPVSAGEHCIHNGVLYTAKQNINSSEVWTAAHWEAGSVSSKLTEISNAIDGVNETKAPVIKNNVTGNPAIFYDGVNGLKIENIKINFKPYQEGSGEPTKDNVRNIVGRTSLNVYHSGADTSDHTTIPVSWTENGAIVGGNVDIITGDLYKTYEVASGRYGSIKTGQPHQTTRLVGAKLTFANKVKSCYSQTDYDNGNTICNVCGKIIFNNYSVLPAHYYNTSTDIWMALPEDMDNEQIVQVVGILQNPIKVTTLTKQQIETLAGINQIWTDVEGVCEVNYSADTNVYINSRTSGYVTPEMFGAVSDGTTNDTDAIVKAIATGKRVVMDGNYYCEDITLPAGCEIELHGNIKLHGTITINKSNVSITGNGSIKAYDTEAFMIYPKYGDIMTSININGLIITGDNTNTCFALTNLEANAGMCFININCDILDFLYGVHSYKTETNDTWFSAMFIDGTIRDCLLAVHFDWAGWGSCIRSTIQPKVNSSQTENRPLVIISSNTIVEGMIWDYGQANNKKLIRIKGNNNKILSAIPVYKIECAAGNDFTLVGDISPLRETALQKITTVFNGVHIDDTLPVKLPYGDSNDMAYMAGTNKVSVSVTPSDSTLTGYVNDLLANKVNSIFIQGSVFQNVVIDFDFPQSVPLREVVIAGQDMPDEVVIEYKDTNGTYHELADRELGTDYESKHGADSYAYWQYVYQHPGEFTDDFAKGVRITLKTTAVGSYMITRIYIGVAKTLFVNKNGDDIVATSLKLKSGNDYYTLSISNGEVVATLDT